MRQCGPMGGAPNPWEGCFADAGLHPPDAPAPVTRSSCAHGHPASPRNREDAMKKMILVPAAVVCLSIPAAANANGSNPLAGPGRGLAELLRILIVMRSPKYRGIGRT